MQCVFSKFVKPFWNIGKGGIKCCMDAIFKKKFSLPPGTLLDLAPN